MICLQCHRENRAGAAVCAGCGAPLAATVGAGPTRFEESRAAADPGEAGGTLYEDPALQGLTLAPGEVIAGRYRVERQLGAGGMGRVYLVWDATRQARVALKLMAPALRNSPEALERFQREANICLGLAHPGIVRLYDLAEWGGQYYLTMEYLEGETLDAWRRRRRGAGGGGRPDWAAIAGIFDQILDAVGAVHAAGVVHRDLTPHNIMLVRRGGAVRPVILDFGIAKAADDPRFSRSTRAVGTVHYMAPEQGRGGRGIDARADIYSLGAILYEVLTGNPAAGRFPAPSTAAPGLNKGVDELVFKCLEQDPGRRFANAGEMQRALRVVGRKRKRGGPVGWAVVGLGCLVLIGMALAFSVRHEVRVVSTDTSLDTSPAFDRPMAKEKVIPSPRPEATLVPTPAATPTIHATPKPTPKQTPAPTTTPKTTPQQVGSNYTEDLGGGVKLEMVWIPGGTFNMGNNMNIEDMKRQYDGYYEAAPKGESLRIMNEYPAHDVNVAGFWLGKTEVTNEIFRKYRPEHNSGAYRGYNLNVDNHPVVNVSKKDAVMFCIWLSRKSGRTYRLPSEAQWEYACRANTMTSHYWGNDYANMGLYANVADRKGKEAFHWNLWGNDKIMDGFEITAPVGCLRPNEFGLYDMLGNVYEWCQDCYHENYKGAPVDGNAWESSVDESGVVRGGSWNDTLNHARASFRDGHAPEFKANDTGFRVCVYKH